MQLWRRGAATAVDYALVGAWALLLATLSVGLGGGRLFAQLSPVEGQLLGLATLTVPMTLGIAAAEARGGSPGKRLLRLRLETQGGGRVSFGTSLLRTAAKMALPWELAHVGVWQFAAGEGGTLAFAATAAAYATIAVTAIGVLHGLPWYDRLCRTRVRIDRTADD